MKKTHIILLFLAAYSLALGIRVYWLSQKSAFHVDEGMSVAISCYNDYIITKNYEYNREFTGKEIKEASLVSDASLKKALKDIKSLWKDNRDPPHTNLYYTFFRLSLIGLKTGEIHHIIFRGGLLNLIFFSVSFVFFFLLMRLLFPNAALLQILATACAFLSTAAISNTLFLRPYQIQEMMFIMFCYYFLRTIDYRKIVINDGKWYINNSLLYLSLILAAVLLTGYYAILFIGFFGIYAIYRNCREKTYLDTVFYVLVLILGIMFAQALYTRYLDGYASYRATETKHTLSGNAINNIAASSIAAGSIIKDHFFTYPVIAVCAACIIYMIYRKQKPIIPKHALFVFTVSVLYLFITLVLAPYKVLRYSMPVFPFFILLPAMIVNSVNIKPKVIPNAAMLALYLFFLIGAANQNRIENLFRDKPDDYVFARDKDIPVYVNIHYYEKWNYANTWKFANLIPYLNNDQKYYFIKNFDDIFSGQYDDFYLVVENTHWLNEAVSKYNKLIKDTVMINGREPETMEPYFMCLRIRLNEAP
ncbi:MAG: glycosyltransferase family 39 protein [Treponema sp.]|nr:glycosyltransferase family 39 protein [Treponema sp.]